MAELILTPEEKAAATWFELDDDTIGKAVKACAGDLVSYCNERERIHSYGAALFLCSQAHSANAETMTLTLDGMYDGDTQLGDWSVTVQKVSPNA